MVAEHGQLDTGLADDLQQVSFALDEHGDAVDFHHIRDLHAQNSSLTAPNEQFVLHAPHLMHFD